MAPAADEHPNAVVQVYVARARGWKGVFAVHSWIAFRAKVPPHMTATRSSAGVWAAAPRR